VNTIEQCLAFAVVVLFVAGLGLLVAAVRQQNRTRKQWGGRA
jgi:hypothetical protein